MTVETICDGCDETIPPHEPEVSIKAYYYGERVHADLCADCSEELVAELTEESRSVLERVVAWFRGVDGDTDE